MSPLGDDNYVIVYVNIIYHNLKTTRLGSSNNILWIRHTGRHTVISCHQPTLRTLLSDRPSVCLSVCHNFPQCSSHCIINFQEFLPLTRVVSMQMVKVIGKRSMSPRTKQIYPQFRGFRTVTPVWTHGWPSNDAQSIQWRRRGSILFLGHPSNFKVTRADKSTILTQIERFQTVTPI